MEDTAAAALDATTPQALRIASFQMTPRELRHFSEATRKTPFVLKCLGTRDELAADNLRERAAHPEGEAENYPSWQQSQYLHSMFSTHRESLDNDRYPNLKWASLRDVVPRRG